MRKVNSYSHGNQHDEVLCPVFSKIAFCIDGDGGGHLDIGGEECGNGNRLEISCFNPKYPKQQIRVF